MEITNWGGIATLGMSVASLLAVGVLTMYDDRKMGLDDTRKSIREDNMRRIQRTRTRKAATQKKLKITK